MQDCSEFDICMRVRVKAVVANSIQLHSASKTQFAPIAMAVKGVEAWRPGGG